MDKYEVLGQVGEGSFGQVYKARKRCNGEIVAFKVIRKRGRSLKELKSLRQECEIQRRLHHPNIVQMLDSFETDNEIVVVIEYADKELYELLGKAGRLSEERAQVIACDLVSALYYLHSNRVLHRDLKPQNILLEANGVAKVCDFGFARNMSTRTHVLTSMKGTPLYMAPELIEGCPYDHNADLWSLGCIIYELIVGTPPFQTTNILHLAILLRFKAVKWPDFISHNCKSFLQGLLQKEPSQRLTWPQLLDHPFVKDRILKVGETALTPFTAPLSASQAWAKQKQFESLVMCSENQFKVLEKAVLKIQEQERKLRSQRYNRTCVSQPRMSAFGYCPLNQQYHALHHSEPSGTDSSASVDVLLGNLSLRASLRSDLLAAEHALCENQNPENKIIRPIFTQPENSSDKKLPIIPSDAEASPFTRIQEKSDKRVETYHGDGLNVVGKMEKSLDSRLASGDGDCHKQSSRLSVDYEREFGDDDETNSDKQIGLADWDPSIVERHIENEEWIAFLQRSMEELMDGEIDSVLQENCVSVFVSPLRNPAAGCRVVEYVACLLSLPFSIKLTRQNVEKIERVYLDVRVVPNLVYAMKLLMYEREDEQSEINVGPRTNDVSRSATELSADELQALECSMLVLCRLIHAKEQFLTQFCEAVHIVNGMSFLRQLLTLEKRKARIVADLVAILNNIVRSQPENAELVEIIVLRAKTSDETVETFSKLLNHRQNVIRARTCTLIRLLGRFCCRALQRVWGKRLRNLVEPLVLDDDETVRNAAEGATGELKQLMFYDQDDPRE